MSLTVGSNSYVTVAQANTYLQDRMGTLAWFALEETGAPGVTSKEVLLVTAYNWLLGSPTLDLPAVSSETLLMNAQIESALYLLTYYSGIDSRRAKRAQGVESFKLGDRSETFVEGSQSEIPSNILGMLMEYSSLGGVTFDLKGQYDV